MPKETFFNLNEEKQEKIMRAAISEFTAHGFEKGKVANIAKKAGVAKGSMYQYFEDKTELFLYSVKWTTDMLMKKYNVNLSGRNKITNIFDLLYESSSQIWVQMREEREAVIFVQDVFLGRYKGINDKSMEYMLKASEQHVLMIVKEGKENGYIRKDISDEILTLFISGAVTKVKEHMMLKVKNMGECILDEDYKIFDDDTKALVEMLKNGISL